MRLKGRSMSGDKPSRTVSRHMPVEYYVLSRPRFEGMAVGMIDGRTITDVAIDAAGERYRYVGVAAKDTRGRYDVHSQRDGEWIVEHGLVYRTEKKRKIYR